MKAQFRQTFSKPDKIEYWGTVYDQHDFDAECLRLRMNKAMAWLDDLHLNGSARVLDAGCGGGRQLIESVKKGYNTVGMDFSHPMLVSACNKLGPDSERRAGLCLGDLELLPFQDSSFDAVICLGVITYLSSETSALHELARVLKPGGTLIFSMINKARLVRFFDLPVVAKEMYLKILGKLAGTPEKKAALFHNSYLKSYSVPAMVDSLEQAGFSIGEYETIPLEMPTLFGKRVFAPDTSRKIAFLFERAANIPIVKTFGGMCLFRVEKSGV